MVWIDVTVPTVQGCVFHSTPTIEYRMSKKTLIIGLLTSVVLFMGCGVTLVFGLALAVAQQAMLPKLETVVYGTSPDGQELKLDLARGPAGKPPAPFILWIHGGGWQRGDRKDYHSSVQGFAKLGWAGATVQYRLAPKHKFPAQIDDVRMALTFLREHAKEYNFDPDRIAVCGGSAGGHLSLLLALAPDKDGKVAPGIRAVVSYAGPADFRTWRVDAVGEKWLKTVNPRGLDGLISDFVGTTDRTAPVMTEVSPVAHIKAGVPPVLSLQGGADPLVPPQQAQELHAALKKAGVVEKLVVYEGGGHGLAGEQATKAVREMVEFLDKHVR